MKPFALALLTFSAHAPAALAQTYYPPLAGNTWATVDPASIGWCTENLLPLHDFLASSNSKAFIVLKDGRIAIEWHFGTFTQDSLWYWASAGKSLTAFLVGKAQEEGLLSIEEPSSNYLGTGWTSCTPAQEQAITIRHQLTMTTGLDDGVPAPFCTAPSCLQYLAPPGTRWAYHNGPYTLLDGVLTAATGSTLNAYVFNKLTLTTGLQGAFAQLDDNNVFFSKPRAFARFGLLCMGGGSWNGNAVMSDQAYFNAMVSPSQGLNEAYGYLWWLNGQSTFMLPQSQFVFNGPLSPNAPPDAYSALGKNGQICTVSPQRGLVVVRMGNEPSGLFVPNVYHDQLWQYLNAVICGSTGVAEPPSDEGLALFPNPADEQVTVLVDGAAPRSIRILGADGRACITQQRVQQVATRELAPGNYVLDAEGADGRLRRQRLVIAR